MRLPSPRRAVEAAVRGSAFDTIVPFLRHSAIFGYLTVRDKLSLCTTQSCLFEQTFNSLVSGKTPLPSPSPPPSSFVWGPASPIPSCFPFIDILTTAMPSLSLLPFTASSRSFLTEYLHTSTCKFLDDVLEYSSPCHNDVREYCVYTDGSGGSNINKLSGPPSWAFVVVAVHTDGRSHIVGYLASPDSSLTDAAKYKHPSAPAEFSAALWFVCWLLQSAEHFLCKPFCLHR